MSILVNEDTRLVVQGITGKEGTFHTDQMLEFGTQIVAGVTPNKGRTIYKGIPVFNTLNEAVKQTGANTSVIFVPPPFAADAICEAAMNGIKLIVCITEGIPTQDMIIAREIVLRHNSYLIGPNCPGIVTPGIAKVGIMPAKIFSKGHVGVVSRSGTLTYEAVHQLTLHNLGQSTAIGIGGDPILGLNFKDVLKLFQKDLDTKLIVMIGEIGGDAEEDAATIIRSEITKPVVSFIAGATAPPGRRLGHAGAIVSGGKGTAEEKKRVLKNKGVYVVDNPANIGVVCKRVMDKLTG